MDYETAPTGADLVAAWGLVPERSGDLYVLWRVDDSLLLPTRYGLHACVPEPVVDAIRTRPGAGLLHGSRDSVWFSTEADAVAAASAAFDALAPARRAALMVDAVRIQAARLVAAL